MFAAALLFVLGAEPSLHMFDRLVGHCWSAELSAGARDIHCFSPVFAGQHVRDTHRVVAGGRAVYRGETLYSREGAAVTFVYLSSLGGIGRGSVTRSAVGIDFAGTMRAGPAAQAKPFRSAWQWTGATSYAVRNDGGVAIRFRRLSKRGLPSNRVPRRPGR